MPADELLARLKAGKVYLPEQAERAAQQLLPQGQPDGAARARAAPHRRPRRGRRAGVPRRTRSIEPRLEDRGVAAVLHRAAGPGGDDVVRSAARLAQQLGVDWHAVYVETPALQRLPTHERERILQTVKLAQELRREDRDPRRQRAWPPRWSTTRGSTTARRSSSAVRDASRAGRGVRGRWRSASARSRADIDLIEVGRAASRKPRRPARERRASTDGDPARDVKRRALCVGRRRVRSRRRSSRRRCCRTSTSPTS